MFINQNSNAQLSFCNDNSGNPIFTENFDVGTTINPLPAGTDNYNYTHNTTNVLVDSPLVPSLEQELV